MLVQKCCFTNTTGKKFNEQKQHRWYLPSLFCCGLLILYVGLCVFSTKGEGVCRVVNSELLKNACSLLVTFSREASVKHSFMFIIHRAKDKLYKMWRTKLQSVSQRYLLLNWALLVTMKRVLVPHHRCFVPAMVVHSMLHFLKKHRHTWQRSHLPLCLFCWSQDY